MILGVFKILPILINTNLVSLLLEGMFLYLIISNVILKYQSILLINNLQKKSEILGDSRKRIYII